MTRVQVRDLIRKRLGETTAAFWTDAELNTWIDDGCTDLAYRAKCIRTNGYMTPTTAAEYSLTSTFPNCLSIDEVYFFQCISSDTSNSTWQKLIPTSRTILDIDNPSWKSSAGGVPTKYYWDREENLFGFYVKPDSNNTGANYCRGYYRKAHVDMTNDNDTPDVPENLQPAICDYVVALGYEQRGWGDKANDTWQKYFTKIRDYEIERDREKEDEEIISRNYRNIY